MKVKVKKRLMIVIGGLCLIIGLVGYMGYTQGIQNGQDTIVKIYQNDENGTPINSPSPIKLVSKAGHRNPFKDGILEYVLDSKNPLKNLVSRKNQTVRLRYRSELTSQQLRRRLNEADYWQVGAQNVTTPIFNGTQVMANGRMIARISTSKDGRHWTKLPISYPNESVKHPTLLYQKGQLMLFDRSTVYETTDFKSWNQHHLPIKSSQFNAGRLQSVIPNLNTGAVVVAVGTKPTTGKRQLFYSDWQATSRRISQWHQLNTGKVKLNGTEVVTKVDKNFYLLTQRGKYVQLYRAASLKSQFRKVASVKFNIKKKQKLESLNLIKVSHKHYRLFYSKMSTGNVNLGTYCEDLDATLNSDKSAKKVTTDYLWTNFSLVENKGR